MIVEGWASTDERDFAGHIVRPSAYAKPIRDRGLRGPRGIKLLFHHDQTKPLGHIVELDVRNSGLWIKADIDEGISYGNDIARAIKAQGGLSFSVGFYPVDWYFDIQELPVFTEVELDEISVVVSPCNERAMMSATEKSGDNLADLITSLSKINSQLRKLTT